jgi:hypothetical protein
MDATDRIVIEIRALRNGVDTPLAARDPAINPFTLELTDLQDIADRLQSGGFSAGFFLEQIRNLQQAANEGDAESLEELLRIGAIIAGAA